KRASDAVGARSGHRCRDRLPVCDVLTQDNQQVIFMIRPGLFFQVPSQLVETGEPGRTVESLGINLIHDALVIESKLISRHVPADFGDKFDSLGQRKKVTWQQSGNLLGEPSYLNRPLAYKAHFCGKPLQPALHRQNCVQDIKTMELLSRA